MGCWDEQGVMGMSGDPAAQGQLKKPQEKRDFLEVQLISGLNSGIM